jgi:aminopeptidase N
LVTVTGPETAFATTGDAVVLDPYEDSWAVVVPDAATMAKLKTLLPAVEDHGLRAGIWNGVRSGFHNAAVSPADVVDLVVASPPVESTEDTKRRLGSWLLGDVLPLAPAGSLERVHAAALGKVSSTPAGSEHQLSGLRMAISTATAPDVLRGWLATTPDGIDLDLDLRWRILVRLATLGATDRAELQAALDAEPTAVSRVEHMRAVVSLPTAEAKEHAWSVFTGQLDVPNYELEAAGLGMWRGGQEELTAPYVDRYFDELPDTVRIRSGWVLADATDFFFPHTSVTGSTLARARALAADESLDPSVRRRLGDNADDLSRLLAIRAAYPAS